MRSTPSLAVTLAVSRGVSNAFALISPRSSGDRASVS
jgi:hypothetical protein